MKTVKVTFSIPFYTQRVTEESWKTDGFPSFQEGHLWEDRGCGIASLRMVLDGMLKEKTSLPQGSMIEKGLLMEAYKAGVGWIHQGLAKMAMDDGVFATAYREKTLEDVAQALRENRPCIISVTPRFVGGEEKPEGGTYPKGGHLVVAYGYEAAEDGTLEAFLIHHPSCFLECNWADIRVPIEKLNASFSGNFIAFGEESE